MVEPITLAALGATALAEGIKFLYAQAGETIKWWRERKSAADPVPVVEQAPVKTPLIAKPADEAAVARLEEDIRKLRGALAVYADDVAPEPADPGNADLLATVDALRQALEAALGQDLTWAGEERPERGTGVDAAIDVEQVAGYVAAVRARSIEGGQVRAHVRAGTVEPGGQVIGVEADQIR
jgi:hypothetical protein